MDGSPSLPASRTVTVGDTAFSYAEAGNGPALVLLHGIGSAARSWAPQFAGLADEFRVIAWDAPGYGGSTPVTPERPDASDYAAALTRLLDALGVEHLHLVGHSLGTVTALRFARQHAKRVRSLTLASLSSGHARLSAQDQKRLRDARFTDLEALGPRGMAQKRAPRLLSAGATPAQMQLVLETMSSIDPDGFRQAVWMLSAADTATGNCPPIVPMRVAANSSPTGSRRSGSRASSGSPIRSRWCPTTRHRRATAASASCCCAPPRKARRGPPRLDRAMALARHGASRPY